MTAKAVFFSAKSFQHERRRPCKRYVQTRGNGGGNVIRLSKLLNRAVICADIQAGFLQNVVLDESQKNVESLIVANGLRGKRVVPAQAITAVCAEFILVNAMQKYARGIERKNPSFVRDSCGLLIGRITDHALDENTLQISAIEMVRGYLPSERRQKIWLFTYTVSDSGSGELNVPVIENPESIDWKEEGIP